MAEEEASQFQQETLKKFSETFADRAGEVIQGLSSPFRKRKHPLTREEAYALLHRESQRDVHTFSHELASGQTIGDVRGLDAYKFSLDLQKSFTDAIYQGPDTVKIGEREVDLADLATKTQDTSPTDTTQVPTKEAQAAQAIREAIRPAEAQAALADRMAAIQTHVDDLLEKARANIRNTPSHTTFQLQRLRYELHTKLEQISEQQEAAIHERFAALRIHGRPEAQPATPEQQTAQVTFFNAMVDAGVIDLTFDGDDTASKNWLKNKADQSPGDRREIIQALITGIPPAGFEDAAAQPPDGPRTIESFEAIAAKWREAQQASLDKMEEAEVANMKKANQEAIANTDRQAREIIEDKFKNREKKERAIADVLMAQSGITLDRLRALAGAQGKSDAELLLEAQDPDKKVNLTGEMLRKLAEEQANSRWFKAFRKQGIGILKTSNGLTMEIDLATGACSVDIPDDNPRKAQIAIMDQAKYVMTQIPDGQPKGIRFRAVRETYSGKKLTQESQALAKMQIRALYMEGFDPEKSAVETLDNSGKPKTYEGAKQFEKFFSAEEWQDLLKARAAKYGDRQLADTSGKIEVPKLEDVDPTQTREVEMQKYIKEMNDALRKLDKELDTPPPKPEDEIRPGAGTAGTP